MSRSFVKQGSLMPRVVHLQDILFVSCFDGRHEDVLGIRIVDYVYSVAEQAT